MPPPLFLGGGDGEGEVSGREREKGRNQGMYIV